jgi:GDP-D-mannose 3',5'-epimerase
MHRIAVTGAGGFIGHHLVKRLKARGHWVRGVDVKYPEFEASPADEFLIADLRLADAAAAATVDVEHVYALAADMGGMGFISANHARILRNNSLINIHTLDAAHGNGVQRYLYTSSACVYPQSLQTEADVRPLREADAYPADPQDAYGWEKLLTERLCTHYREDFGLATRIVRFHNVYGPLGTWRGGREKAPAAICRKVAEAPDGATIDVWGDGRQTRSFCYIEDCLDGIERLMASDFHDPLNLGSDEMVSVDEPVAIVAAVAGKSVRIRHVEGPMGVRGRNSDNELCRRTLGWSPTTSLADGLRPTYAWIEQQVSARRAEPTIEAEGG